VNEDHIDASVGLTLSLRLFERYRKNGILQASIRRIPGFRGPCKAHLRLVEGKVVACEIEDSRGMRHPATIAFLARLDQEKGPFEWNLLPTSAPPFQPALPSTERPVYVPRSIAKLDLEQLAAWEPRYRIALYMVYSWIDGRRSMDEIKANISLPSHIVDEAFRILLLLKVVE
jgi:hypothetical protein